ncbi:beta-lactamase-like protein, partial [Colletotrichum phormii]
TGDGLIVFDALNKAAEAEGILIPSLSTLGFTASDIKHLVITHEHFDHYGGARWLQDNFYFSTYASATAWKTLSQFQDGPIKDKTISDGDQLTIGNVTFNFFVTPGHTPGTVSTIFEVSDNGAKHIAGFYGGVGITSSASAKDRQVVSLNRFADLAKQAGVDTLIANH